MNTRIRYWAVIVLLLGATIGLRILSHGESVPARQSLSNFPLKFGTWLGRETPIEADVLKIAGVDDYLSRLYVSPGKEPISVYIGYYKSQRSGHLIHSPKNCLPGSGWEPIRSGRITLTSSEGIQVPVNLYVIENGLRRQLVLYWYQTHGRVIASEYSAKAYMVLDAIRMNRTDAALVRVITPLDLSETVSLERARQFATEFLANSDQYLPR
jgi:EpsI family protein